MKIFAGDLRTGDLIRTEGASIRVTGTNPDPDGDHIFIHFDGKSMRANAAQIFDVERAQ